MFSTVLDDSGRPAGSRRRLRLPLGVAFGLHAAAAGFVLAARVWTIEEAPEPPVRIVFYDAPAPELGDGGEGQPAPAASRQPTEETAAPDPQEAQPVPETAPQTAQADPARTSGDTAEGNDRDATGTGSPGSRDGLPGGVPQGTGKGPANADIFRPGGDVLFPVLVLRVEPVYPELAKRIHAEGLVVVDAVISATGVVEDVRIVKSVHPLLDAEAVRAIGQWRYRPATRSGSPVRVLLTVTVNFSLR